MCSLLSISWNSDKMWIILLLSKRYRYIIYIISNLKNTYFFNLNVAFFHTRKTQQMLDQIYFSKKLKTLLPKLPTTTGIFAFYLIIICEYIIFKDKTTNHNNILNKISWREITYLSISSIFMTHNQRL